MKCAKCDETNELNFYKNKPYFCKQCSKRYQADRARFLKKRCVEYKGGQCEKCGYSKNVRALDFHHLNPDEKEFLISKKMKHAEYLLFEDIKPELDKCKLLCSNCHREEHGKEYVPLFQDHEIEEMIKKKARRGSRSNKQRQCLNCNKAFTRIARKNPKFCCSQCAANYRIAPCPPAVQFKLDADVLSMKKMGQKYNVGAATLKKWADQIDYDIMAWRSRSKFSNKWRHADNGV